MGQHQVCRRVSGCVGVVMVVILVARTPPLPFPCPREELDNLKLLGFRRRAGTEDGHTDKQFSKV